MPPSRGSLGLSNRISMLKSHEDQQSGGRSLLRQRTFLSNACVNQSRKPRPDKIPLDYMSELILRRYRGGLRPQYLVTFKIAKLPGHLLEVLSHQLVFRFAPDFQTALRKSCPVFRR